jgi:hypothetical protein
MNVNEKNEYEWTSMNEWMNNSGWTWMNKYEWSKAKQHKTKQNK